MDTYICFYVANDKFVTSISDNGRTVVDKRGKFSKTEKENGNKRGDTNQNKTKIKKAKKKTSR
jgi:hypothetical protein